MDTVILNDQLVQEVEKRVQDEAILNAFRDILRHEFVPLFYDRLKPSKREWRIVSSSTDEKEWLEKVYTNRPLTVSLDVNNYPNSSSSQPDLMALMMQSALLQPDHHVLEIGTGTGYNAALIAHIVGPENVVTVDINKVLIDLARARIEQAVGSGVTVLHADGRNLPNDLAGFDAIIVTGSHNRIEPSWIRVLAPDGRIVFNWITSLTKVMIEAEKRGRDSLIGRVCGYDGDFMGLHDGSGVQYEASHYNPLDSIKPGYDFRIQIEDQDFSFFLQMNMPFLQLHRYRTNGQSSYGLLDAKSTRRIHFFSTGIRGDRLLWKEICAVYEYFEQLSHPSRVAFSMSADENGIMSFTYKDNWFLIQ